MVNRSIIEPTLGSQGGAYLGEDVNKQPTQAPTQQVHPVNSSVPQAIQNPVDQLVQPSITKKKQKPVATTMVQDQMTEQQDISGTPNRVSGDISGKVNLKDNKGGLQQIAEKKGIVKDGEILNQEALTNQAINRASVTMKAMSERGEKIDEASLADIFDKQLKSLGIKSGTPQFAQAQQLFTQRFYDTQRKLGYNTPQEAFDSINSKYKELNKLNNVSEQDIVNNYDKYTEEQKSYLSQNNQAYAKAKEKIDANKKIEQINAEASGNITKKTLQDDIKEKYQFAEGDSLAELETDEMKELFSNISQYDNEIVTLQDEIDPEKLSKSIQSRYPTSLTTGALKALADNEFNVKSEKLNKLLKLRELAKDTYDTRRKEIIENDKLIRQRDDEVISSLLDNGGMGLMATSQKDIDQMVENGQLSKAGATLIKKQQQGMMSNTMQTLGFVTPQMQKSIDSMIAKGMGPGQIMQSLINTGVYRPPLKQDRTATKMEDGSMLMYDQTTGETRQIKGQSGIQELGGTVEPIDADKLLNCISNAQSIPDATSSGLNCATFLNKIGISPVGTTIQEKIKRITPGVGPVPGSVMVLSGMSQPTYGHVALVERVNPDGTIQIREANYNGKGGIRSAIVDPNNPSATRGVPAKIEGYQVPGGVKQIQGSDNSISLDKIMEFNDDTSVRKMSSSDKRLVGEKKNEIMTNPNSNIEDIMKYSQGGKKVDVAQLQKLTQYKSVVGQIGNIEKELSSIDTGPLLGILRSNNPYDTKAQQIQAMLTAVVPSLTRGVYGEVGVLTDQDIANYSKTLPNLKQTKDVQKAVLAMTLDILGEGYKGTLQSLAAGGRDVSGYAGTYKQIKNQSDMIKNKITSGGKGDDKMLNDLIKNMNTNISASGTARSRTSY